MMKGYLWVLLLTMTSMECVAGLSEAAKAYNVKDYQTAFKEFLPLATNGHASAQFNLGVMYYNGKGVAQDYSQAVMWYRKAAAQGHASAQLNLGFMYDNGKGVAQDYSQAVGWYRKAGTQGHSRSLNNLGVFYEFGQFSAKNLVLAHIFYNLAAVNGNEKSVENRDQVTQQLTSAQLSEAQKIASQWVKGQALPTITKTYPSSSKKGK